MGRGEVDGGQEGPKEVTSWGSEWGEERLMVDTEGPMEVASWGRG